MAYRRPLKELRADTEAKIRDRHNQVKETHRPATRDYREAADAQLDRMKELRDERLRQKN